MPKSQPKSQDQSQDQVKQVLNVKGYTVILKKVKGVKFAGVYSGMMGKWAKYPLQVRDFNDLVLLKALLNDQEALKEILETIEKFLVGQ